VGTLLREQKFYHIRVFTRSNADHYDELEFATEDKRPFNPQILVATSGAANAGIDDPEVYGVTRMDFPPSLLDVQQEKGRAGRRPFANSDSDWYLLCLSLESLVVLIQRLHNTPGSKEASYFKAQDESIRDGILLLVLPLYCLHLALEHIGANPFRFLFFLSWIIQKSISVTH